jgi:hypothetical protein
MYVFVSGVGKGDVERGLVDRTPKHVLNLENSMTSSFRIRILVW